MAQLENFRLKVFRTVAEHLSFRRAAEQLFLTQPAVTLQIKALEDDLGVRLFDRTAGRVSLTRQGAVLLRYARKVSALLAEAEQELATKEGRLSGDLAIGVSTTIAQYVLPHLIRAFLDIHPDVRLHPYSGNTDEIVRLLLQGKVSVGLIEGPSRRRELRTEPFMEDELVLIARPDFGPDRLSHKQLLALDLLLREQGSGSRRVVESALARAGLRLKAFKSVVDLDSTEAIKSAVEAGLGVGFVSRWAIAKELQLGALKIVQVTGLRATRHFSVISRTSPAPQGLSAQFREFTRTRVRLLSRAPGKFPAHSGFQP